jgi:hypothetical protein
MQRMQAASCHVSYTPTKQVCVGREVLLGGKCSTNFHILNQGMLVVDTESIRANSSRGPTMLD